MEIEYPHPPMSERFFPCSSCGAKLTFTPGTDSLTCGHCGTVNAIPEATGELKVAAVEELDYHSFLNNLAEQQETVDRVEVICESCAAHTQLPDHHTSGKCGFCGSPIVAQGKSVKLIRPRGLLPFGIDRKKASATYETWLASLWFAPSDLKKAAFLDQSLQGIYLPYWTYDADATTDYTGQRGVDYWVTETYSVTVNGRSQTRTRQVRKTRWYPASGRVFDSFDDILVPATKSLAENRLESLEPWDLGSIAPYDDAYLAGFTAESYSVSLDDGFGRATVRMQPTIDRSICRDIGGDHQIISSKDSRYSDITFKHLLLPVWITAYRYNKRVFRIIINARTGEISGERPWSFWKIFFTVLAGLAVAGGIAAIVAMSQH